MIRSEMVVHSDGTPIETLWKLFPEGDQGTFIFHSEGVTIDFKRVGDEYFYEMKKGKNRVAFAKQLVDKSLMAHVDSRYYTFVHGMARDVQLI
jgi:hypothetical protein